MDKVISKKNLSFIKKVINYLSSKLGIINPRDVLWLVYGSYVINMNNSNSDLDIIGIHPTFIERKRIVFNYKNVPIHFSAITMNDIKDDGESRLYGSYFTGKIINPHIFLYGDSRSRREALFHAGKFIGPLAGYLGQLTQANLYSPAQITALVFVAYFSSVGPSFDRIFLGYFISPEFGKIWKSLCKQTILMLETAEAIRRVGNKYTFTQKFKSFESFHFERMKIAARHWSYGAICHGDCKFPDWLFSKAEEKTKKADPSGKKYREMILFLKTQSGLKDIYI